MITKEKFEKAYDICIKYRVQLLNQQSVLKVDFNKINNLQRTNEYSLETKVYDIDWFEENNLGVRVRILNCLNSVDIETLGELLSYKKKDLLRIRNLGKSSLQVIERTLNELGIKNWN